MLFMKMLQEKYLRIQIFMLIYRNWILRGKNIQSGFM